MNTVTSFNPKSLRVMILGDDERSQGLITALQRLGITTITTVPSTQLHFQQPAKALPEPVEGNIKVQSKALPEPVEGNTKVQSKALPEPVEGNTKVQSKALPEPVEGNTKVQSKALPELVEGNTKVQLATTPNISTSLLELIAQVQPHFLVPMMELAMAQSLVDIKQTATVIPNMTTLLQVMNRRQLRRLAAEELDLPTARYAFAKSYNELQFQINRGIGYPCLVKPIISTGGKGHSIVREAEEVKPAWELATTIGGMSEPAVMVEEFIKFDYEIVQLVVRAPNVWGEVSTHFCEPIGYLHKEGRYVESWQPQQMTPTALHQSREIAKKITAKLGGNSLFALEFLVKGDQVWFNELIPYPHRAGMVTLMTQGQNQFDLHARALLGLPVDTTWRGAGASAVIYSDVNSENLSIEGMTEALSVATVDIYLFTNEKISVNQPLGITLAAGQNIHEARQRANAAVSRIRVAQ